MCKVQKHVERKLKLDLSKEFIISLFNSGPVNIKVNANSRKNEIVLYDEQKKMLVVNIDEKAENNEANREIVKFFLKEYDLNVKIVFGKKSSKKKLTSKRI